MRESVRLRRLNARLSVPRHEQRADIRLTDGDFYAAEPFEQYAWMRANAPVYWDDASKLWVLSRYQEVFDVSKAPETFSAGQGVLPESDAMVSIVIGLVKVTVFGLNGAVTPQVLAFALLVDVLAIPGPFMARAFLARVPVHFHTAILDAVVLLGGVVMVFSALF